MLTAKRLYLYGVLLVSLVLLSWGLADLVRYSLDELARLAGSRPAWAGDFAGEELSRAIALVLVAGFIYAIHTLLARRTLRAAPAAVVDERASAARSSYFFLVLAGSGIACLLSAYELVQAGISSIVFGLLGYDLSWPLGGVIVFGTVWAAHLLVRRADLQAAATRTAGDWLTRAYLYGALLLTCLVFAFQLGDGLTIVARAVLDLEPAWGTGRWWEEAIAGSIAAVSVASIAWLGHWLMAGRLMAAPAPMGPAHERARTRLGYFLLVVLISTTCVLAFTTMGLQHLLSEVIGTSGTASRHLLEDVGGPFLMALPFVATWWWHLRRAVREAQTTGGEQRRRSVSRTSHLVVAFVGLAGLAAGLAWQLQVLFYEVATTERVSLHASAGAPDDATLALALALVGFIVWLPAWVSAQRDRSRAGDEAALDAPRRAYLMLVSGLSVIAAMGSLAYLVWQGTRIVLESGEVSDTSWAFAILVVSAVVLGYHLWHLRIDLAVVHTKGEEMPPPGDRVTETIEISAPVGADFKVLNAAIRTELPDGFELHVVTHDLTS